MVGKALRLLGLQALADEWIPAFEAVAKLASERQAGDWGGSGCRRLRCFRDGCDEACGVLARRIYAAAASRPRRV